MACCYYASQELQENDRSLVLCELNSETLVSSVLRSMNINIYSKRQEIPSASSRKRRSKNGRSTSQQQATRWDKEDNWTCVCKHNHFSIRKKLDKLVPIFFFKKNVDWNFAIWHLKLLSCSPLAFCKALGLWLQWDPAQSPSWLEWAAPPLRKHM